MEENATESGSSRLLTPKRGIALVVLVVVIAAAAVMLFRGIGGDEEASAPTVDVTRAPTPIPLGDPTAPGATGAPSASSSPSAEPTAAPGTGSTPAQTPISVGFGPQAPEQGDWEPAADGFAAAYANPSVGREAWLAALKPFVTGSSYRGFENTDINRVQQDEVEYVLLDDELERIVRFHIYFKGGSQPLMGTAEIQNDGSWLVSSVVPADE